MSFNAAKARQLSRLLKIKEPTKKDKIDIDSLAAELGCYGEQLIKIAKEGVSYGY